MFLVQDAGLAVCSSSPTLGSTPGAAGAERRTRDSAFPFLSSGWSPDLFLDVVSGPILDFANPWQHTRCSRCRALGQRLCWVFLLSSGTRGAAGYGVQLVQNAGLAFFFAFLWVVGFGTRVAKKVFNLKSLSPRTGRRTLTSILDLRQPLGLQTTLMQT